MTPHDPSPLGKQFLLILLCLFSLTIITYGNTLLSPFNYDDETVIREEIVNTGNQFYQLYPPKYRHLFYLSLAVNYSWGELNPVGYHLVNISLHFLTAVLVLFISFITLEYGAKTERKTALGISTATALLFLLNPVQTETVTYLSGRASGLCAFFYLLSLLLFILGSLKKSGPSAIRPVYFLLSFFAFAAAVFSKEIAVTLPAIVIFYDLFFIKGKDWTRRKTRFIFFYIPLLAGAMLVLASSSSLISVIEKWLPRFDPSYAVQQISVIPYAVKLLFFPANLAFDYHFPERFFAQGMPLILSVSFFLTFIFAMVKSNPKITRLFTFSLLWFLVTLSPTNSFLPRTDLLSERNLYLPSFGLFLILATLIHTVTFTGWRKPRVWRFSGVAAVVMILILNSTLLIQRNSVYRSNIKLWEDALEKSPGKLRALHNLSHFYLEEKNYQKAFVPLKKLAASRASPFYLSFAHNNLGHLYTQWEDFTKAEKEFKEAIRTDPTIPTGYFNLASLYASQGKFHEAKMEYEKAEERYTIYRWGYPKPAELAFNKAKVNLKLGLYEEAEQDISRYLQKMPDSGEGRLLLAQIYSATGRERLAVQTYKILQGNPYLQAKAHNDTGILFIKEKKFAEAEKEFTLALSLNPNSPDAHYNLGILLLQTGGDRSKARSHFQAAMQLSQNPARREGIQKQLAALEPDASG